MSTSAKLLESRGASLKSRPSNRTILGKEAPAELKKKRRTGLGLDNIETRTFRDRPASLPLHLGSSRSICVSTGVRDRFDGINRMHSISKHSSSESSSKATMDKDGGGGLGRSTSDPDALPSWELLPELYLQRRPWGVTEPQMSCRLDLRPREPCVDLVWPSVSTTAVADLHVAGRLCGSAIY